MPWNKVEFTFVVGYFNACKVLLNRFILHDYRINDFSRFFARKNLFNVRFKKSVLTFV